ncbi:MAG: hypothetical protein R3207_05545, partial [Oceanospirillum sp.]|nr:hypothetical protein [Oceanospirillum sp.]
TLAKQTGTNKYFIADHFFFQLLKKAVYQALSGWGTQIKSTKDAPLAVEKSPSFHTIDSMQSPEENNPQKAKTRITSKK